MNKLSKEAFKKTEKYIMNSARELDKRLYNLYFHKNSEEELLEEIKNYQNEDGGFGHGIESDFLMPESSPMSTSVAFQYLNYINKDKSQEVIKNGISYLENTYNEGRKGWYAVSERVNDYPHAPWWNFDKKNNQTVIDNYWGNPSAEIIGYLYKHKEFVKNLDIDKLIDTAVTNIKEKKEFESFHEIYCYISLYKNIDAERKSKIKNKITEAVTELVETDRSKWSDYTSKPVDFITDPNMEQFGIEEKYINNNLDYLIENIESNGKINPNWTWGTYPDAWEKAKNNWTGTLTVKALILLDKFGRIR